MIFIDFYLTFNFPKGFFIWWSKPGTYIFRKKYLVLPHLFGLNRLFFRELGNHSTFKITEKLYYSLQKKCFKVLKKTLIYPVSDLLRKVYDLDGAVCISIKTYFLYCSCHYYFGFMSNNWTVKR